MFKNALVSVSDKSGLSDFIKPLAEKGLRVLSTGGTAKGLQGSGIEVVQVSDQTGFPEVMDGRVKTLHPKIHMPLLARGYVSTDAEILSEYGVEPIDLVVVNLYAFEDALTRGVSGRELCEFIDIGGPTLLRAAAKNFERITVLCDPADYEWVLQKSELTLSDRQKLAAKAFAHVSTYDAMIAATLGAGTENNDFSVGGKRVQELRYGENPQQTAAWYRTPGDRGIHDAEILQGKALSYNNILDIDAAVSTLREFSDSICCVSVKHNNPCGVGLGKDVTSAVERSLKADPVSVFGGIVAINGTVDAKSAELLASLFLECIIAQDFGPEAMALLGKKKNLRVLRWADVGRPSDRQQVRGVTGGFLVQSNDEVESNWSSGWEIAGQSPSEAIKSDMVLAWKVCSHLKSNAIALAAGGQTVGLGMGQVNRVDAVEQAIERMRKFHDGATDVVLASDAFFPFADSVELAAQAGIHWVIQPGGSIKDDEVKQRAKELGVNIVFTGRRHFKH